MINGIDVSNFQGNIDWNKVKSDGINFVIIRAGWGKNGRDSKFKENINGAIKAGINNIGIYWFLYAKTEKDIIENANNCISVVGAYKDKINMKIWADWEYDSDNYCKGLNKDTRTKWINTFCKRIEELGYSAGVYLNPDYINNKVNYNALSNYPLWLAFYTNDVNSAMKYKPMIWQYTSKGSVNGIKGNVDRDYFYDTLPVSVQKNPFKEPNGIVDYSPSDGVKWIQWALNNKGNYGLVVDGVFTTQTLEAVKDFQKKNGLVVDGRVGNMTKAKLR